MNKKVLASPRWLVFVKMSEPRCYFRCGKGGRKQEMGHARVMVQYANNIWVSILSCRFFLNPHSQSPLTKDNALDDVCSFRNLCFGESHCTSNFLHDIETVECLLSYVLTLKVFVGGCGKYVCLGLHSHISAPFGWHF